MCPARVPCRNADSAGAPRTSAEFSGKPTLLLFYLGASCLHCTEQLQAFRKQQPEFAKLGIDLIGLSTDNVVDLKASLDSLTVSQRYQPDDDAKRIEEQVKAALAAKPN